MENLMSLVYSCACLAAVALFVANSPRANVEFAKDSLKEVKKNVAAGKAILVDVRSQQEWDTGHIEGSIFLPVTSLRKGGDPKKIATLLPKKTIVYTFCVVGMRAKAAAYVLGQQGYKVRALKPGYEQLIEAGFKRGTAGSESKKSASENGSPRQGLHD
jgi:rhodanese-related sulfurtransferase